MDHRQDRFRLGGWELLMLLSGLVVVLIGFIVVFTNPQAFLAYVASSAVGLLIGVLGSAVFIALYSLKARGTRREKRAIISGNKAFLDQVQQGITTLIDARGH